MEFKYAPMFQLGKDETEYYLLTKDYVSVSEFEGHEILKVAPEALTLMAQQAFHDVSFMLRRSHNEQVAKILRDPEASANDKYVALTFLRNAEVACKGQLPLCQDTGTAIIHGEKGQEVWTGFCDEEALSKGVFNTYTECNLRYSQNAPLNMYDEVNTNVTCRHRSTWRLPKVTNTASSASPKVAVAPTRPISIRRPRHVSRTRVPSFRSSWRR